MGIERVENEDQSSTLLGGLAVKPVWTEYPDQPSPGGVGNSPCAGDIAGASKPAVGLRWCPRLPLTAMTLPLCCGMWSCSAHGHVRSPTKKPVKNTEAMKEVFDVEHHMQ